MINSRKIEDLHPHVQPKADRFIFESKKSGIDLIAISTYRDVECQNSLYAQGRTTAGNPCTCGGKFNATGKCHKHPLGLPVTDARGGDSYHNTAERSMPRQLSQGRSYGITPSYGKASERSQSHADWTGQETGGSLKRWIIFNLPTA